MAIEYEGFKDGGFKYALLKLKAVIESLLSGKVGSTDYATDAAYGIVKTNSAQSVTLNANGQLEVGGRLGQFSGTTGIYASADRDPRAVGNSSFLITDAMGMSLDTNRAFALVSGYGVACRSAAAGATQYRVKNTYANRLKCKMAEGGFASINEATSKVQRIVPVVSVTIGGNPYTPDSSADSSATANDIIITTEETLNPDTAMTNIRLFGVMKSYSTVHVGNGIASNGGGRNLFVGGGITKVGSSNDDCAVGMDMYISGNGNAAFGRWHIMAKNRGFAAGTGHDFTNAPGEGAAAVGQYSSLANTTLFAVGNGTSHTARSNAFEVEADGRVKASGTPTDNDDLTTKAYVDSAIGGGGLTVQTFGHEDFTYQQELDPETQEVVNECVAYSTVTGNAEEPKAVKYGRMVNLCGAFKNINVRPSSAVFVMGKVPAGCEPLYRQSILVQGTSQAKFLLTIETDGTLKCARYSTGASALAVPNNAWLNINATYVSAS